MAILGTRTFDLDEIERLLQPFIHYQAKINLVRPVDRVTVRVTLRSPGLGHTHAELRTAAVMSGNGAILAIEEAGYGHASPPEIRLGGIEVSCFGKEACEYVVDAELSMELLGKREASGS